MATWEGALYSGKTRRPSALVLYIMEHVNPGLPKPYWVHWHSIVGKTPWLAIPDHLSGEELDRFYQEPGLEVLSELEKATEDVYRRAVEDAAQWEGGKSCPPITWHQWSHVIPKPYKRKARTHAASFSSCLSSSTHGENSELG